MRHIFSCIDAHTCGNPVRLVKEGGPNLKGMNMMEKRLDFINNYDWIRTGLMFEPRGHDMMSGSILYPPSNPKNDIGVLFIETSGCLPMCGHGTIGTVTIMLEEKIVTPKNHGELNIETPAGVIHISYEMKNEKVESVKLTNIPSFLYQENILLELEPLGELIIDVAYGGNFYAIVDIQDSFQGVQDYSASQIIEWSRSIREKLNNQFQFIHPTQSNINGLTHLLWTGVPISLEAHGRNAVFYGEKAIDRSPCGTGTSARMAQLFSKGKLSQKEEYIHESYIGSKFKGCIEGTTSIGKYEAIIPSIEGWARIIGYNQIIIDEADPYAHGFQVI